VSTDPREPARAVSVRSFPIELGVFLKLAGAVRSGGEGKALVASGRVRVNGVVERRRGRALAPGDRVAVEGGASLLAAAAATDSEP